MRQAYRNQRSSLRGMAVLFVVCILNIGAADALSAKHDPAVVCDQAALRISKETQVPLDVLMAITRTETGRKHGEVLRPWPWTVNMEGTGVWFDTEEQARKYVFRHFKNGARSFDVGCFQINYKWHGQAFRSIDEMFDPETNTRYAARYLTKLHAEFGSWTKAVGAYHSRTQEYANRYLTRYTEIRESLPHSAAQAPKNKFSLLNGTLGSAHAGSLASQDRRGLGSLFPLSGI